MTAPRLEINLEKIRHNASVLSARLARYGISITAVTKATLGLPEVAAALLRGGVSALGDSRIENIETMRDAGLSGSMTLIRTPMPSQVARIVLHADISLNTEIDVIRNLSAAAVSASRTHGVILLVELGDLREGIMPADFLDVVKATIALPNLQLKGIGTNLACFNGVEPDDGKMEQISRLAVATEALLGAPLEMISGGNSGSLPWVFSGTNLGRINNLRLGEAVLLGREPLHRRPIDGLYTDAFKLVAEVIESKYKPAQPWGNVAQNAFGETKASNTRGHRWQTIVALGRQDTDTDGLEALQGITMLGASSDHLVTDTGATGRKIGSELSFGLNYSALLRACASPYVRRIFSDKPARTET